MAKKIVRYRESGEALWGLVSGDQVLPIPGDYPNLADLLSVGLSVTERANGHSAKSISDLHLMSPVTADAKLICQGLNYAEHQDEAGHSQSDSEEFLHFAKDSTSLSGPYDAIIRPLGCKLLDYEAELGLVLKKAITRATDITGDTLDDYIAGMVVCNDVSARDMMFGASFMQWFKGKSQRSFCPTGPFFYWLEAGEIDDLFNLDLVLKVNGEVRQQANTSTLIYRPEQVLSELSRQIDFNVGDLLLTGTPGGVIAQNTPGSFKALTTLLVNDVERRSAFTEDQLRHARFLEPGDEVRVSISSPDGSIDLGEQITLVEDAKS